MGISLLPPVAIAGEALEPAGGFRSDRRGSGTLGLGTSIRDTLLLVPGTGPRVVPRLRARVAQSHAAQGQQGQQGRRPATGCSGSGRGLLTHLEPPQGCRRRGRGNRQRGSGARRPLWLFVPTPPHWPLRGPSMTHRSPRVPPSLIHFPLRNVTLPFTISRPIASRQGVRGKVPKG